MTDNVEHEIQHLMLERLGIEWTPGEPFYSLIEMEIGRLAHVLAESEAENDQWQKKVAELWAENARLERLLRHESESLEQALAEVARLRVHIEKGHGLVNDMDLRMPEQATEDADGWINSYRIPVGPWHRLLGWARGG